MNDDLTNVFGQPRYFKQLPIYPVKMKDITSFYDYVQCLLIPKNSIQDNKIVRMSYLRFLIELSYMEEYRGLLDKLIKLLQLILRTDDIELTVNEKEKFIIIIDGIYQIHELQFDKIKTIISEQNLIDLKDEYVHPDVQRALDDAAQFMAKKASKTASLDQQIVAYHCESKFTYDQIKELTIYQFNKGIERYDLKYTASAILNARYTGMVEFKDEASIPHWLNHIEKKDKNEQYKLDAGTFINKAEKIING